MMLSPEVMSLFTVQRPRPRRFPFFGEKSLKLEQRNPLTGKAARNPATGKYWNTTNAAGVPVQCCCNSAGPCKCKNEDGTTGALHDTLIATFAGVNIPVGPFRFPGAGPGNCYQISDWPINGTFCLKRVDNSCRYMASVPGLYEWWVPPPPQFEFSPPNCCQCGGYTGDCTHFAVDTLTITVDILFFEGNAIVMQSDDAGAGVLPGDFGTFVNFDSDSPFTRILLPCGGSVTIPNEMQYYLYDCPVTSFGSPHNFGGTLTLTDATC